MENFCIYCDEDIPLDSAKFSIFQRDSLLQKCLVYKIFQITGFDMIYQNDASFLCSKCRYLLVQINELEREFVGKFHGKGIDRTKKESIFIKDEELNSEEISQTEPSDEESLLETEMAEEESLLETEVELNGGEPTKYSSNLDLEFVRQFHEKLLEKTKNTEVKSSINEELNNSDEKFQNESNQPTEEPSSTNQSPTNSPTKGLENKSAEAPSHTEGPANAPTNSPENRSVRGSSSTGQANSPASSIPTNSPAKGAEKEPAQGSSNTEGPLNTPAKGLKKTLLLVGPLKETDHLEIVKPRKHSNDVVKVFIRNFHENLLEKYKLVNKADSNNLDEKLQTEGFQMQEQVESIQGKEFNGKWPDSLPTKIKPFTCKFCSKTFEKKSRHYEHERYHDKRFKCNLCPYKAGKGRDLTLHKLVHSGEKPFKCPVCPKALRQKYKLKLHMKKRHNKTEFHCE